MKPVLWFFTVALLFSAFHEGCAEITVLKNTLSQDSLLAIASETTESGNESYWFYDTKAAKKIGKILPAMDVSELRGKAFLTSWSPDASKVAVLFFYGRRMESTMLFERRGKEFRELEFVQPDPLAIFFKNHPGKEVEYGGSGGDYHALGSWIDNQTVQLAQGTAKDVGSGEGIVFLTTYKARIQKSKVKVLDITDSGKMSDAAVDEFYKAAGYQYCKPGLR